jgi:H+/Cl- antiporter ClcA
MAFPKSLKELCTPAYVYFILSVIGIIASAIQNMGNKSVYRMGMFSARVPSTILVFLVKIVYILFWTWILNLICKDGHKGIAWFLVLIPFILLFVIMGLVMVNPGMIEGMTEGMKKVSKNAPKKK